MLNKITNQMLTLAVLCCCSLLGAAHGQETLRVLLERKAAGVGAQETVDKINAHLLKTGGFGSEFGRKNVDDHGPISDLLKEFGHSNYKKHVPLIEQVNSWFTGFALQAGYPKSGGRDSGSHSRLGEVDFSNMENNTLKKRLYDSVMKEQDEQGISHVAHGKRSHPMVRADAKIDISNYLNLQYIGPVWMGSANQQLGVIYDTGSDWLVLDTDFCSTCHSPVFDTAASTTYANVSSTP